MSASLLITYHLAVTQQQVVTNIPGSNYGEIYTADYTQHTAVCKQEIAGTQAVQWSPGHYCDPQITTVSTRTLQ